MNKNTGLQFLRPYLSTDLPVRGKFAYIRFYNSSKCLASPATSPQRRKKKGTDSLLRRDGVTTPSGKGSSGSAVDFGNRGPVEQRVEELKAANALVYPRIQRSSTALTCGEFAKRYGNLTPGQERPAEGVTIRGRVLSVRIVSKGLIFLDIVHDSCTIQALCNLSKLETFSGVLSTNFRKFAHLVRRGDIISVFGHPYVTKTGELSVNAMELPTILSPSLPLLPTVLGDPETRIRNRHVDLLVNKHVADTIRVRSHIIKYMRDFLLRDNFLEVQTPIITDKASGAIARPFTTVATEFLDKELALRIAPEIWLKRLILGGLDRVFEIGPAFRNEGLDSTHNPEFTTCEFYKSFADLEDLISMTERLFSGLAERVKSLRQESLGALPELDENLFAAPFKRIQFIPAVEAALGEPLPPLTADDATEQLLALFTKHNIPLPTSQTLPRLLDKLSSVYIEPQCNEPTFIMHHPACMAPLAKSFVDTKTKQVVSARVELFVQHKELANMYEEENSPFEQREKFLQQAQWKDDENRAGVDESYLEALECALPPTGGWGCGIDRLCMLFSGATRISDVLAFGSLRNVVNLGNVVNPGKQGVKEEEKDATVAEGKAGGDV